MSLNNKAFTLIELSMVLIIVSLITAGIVGGSALIKNAEIRGAVNEVSNIKVAINNFQFKYDALPGDMVNATDYWPGITSNGDGNGHFQTGDIPVDNEGGYLWHHLGLAEMYRSFPRSNTANWSYEYGVSTPEIVSNTAAVGQNRVSSPASNRYGTQSNYVQIGSWLEFSGVTQIVDGYVGITTASMIDKKMDDGIASAGRVFSYSSLAGSCTDYSGAGRDYQQPYGTVNYDLGDPDGICRMAFLVFND